MDPAGSSLALQKTSPKKCKICGQPAHGKHYGALTCRACAAFFRREGDEKSNFYCKMFNQCKSRGNGWFSCKKCRLQKCFDEGMSRDRFQYDRDIWTSSHDKVKIPETMGSYLGRANWIIFSVKNSDDGDVPKQFLNFEYLMENVRRLFDQGCDSPTFSLNSLEKLAIGLQKIEGPTKTLRKSKIMAKIGKDTILKKWEGDILKVATWLTYLDEFQKLDGDLKIKLLKAMWQIWLRIEICAVTAKARKNENMNRKMISYISDDDAQNFVDWENADVDLSWCSKYTHKQLRLFLPQKVKRTDDAVQAMMDLDPSDIEVCFMMCQLSFYYVGKQYQGKILETCERLQEVVSDSLHDYYVNKMKTPRYATRLANMMKINNSIQKDILEEKSVTEIVRIFDFFYLEFSEPDMFEAFI